MREDSDGSSDDEKDPSFMGREKRRTSARVQETKNEELLIARATQEKKRNTDLNVEQITAMTA